MKMQENILSKATTLFLNLGFKSVTMDDIAKEMGVSKKTIYSHFATKSALVNAVTLSFFDLINDGIRCICSKEQDPIEELYEVKRFVMFHLKDEKSSPQYQLQKYYPKIFFTLQQKQFELMQDCVKTNLKRGIDLGVYRSELDLDFVARIYFNGVNAIKNIEMFPTQQFPTNALMNQFLEYHLRGICTDKGILKLNQTITSNLS